MNWLPFQPFRSPEKATAPNHDGASVSFRPTVAGVDDPERAQKDEAVLSYLCGSYGSCDC